MSRRKACIQECSHHQHPYQNSKIIYHHIIFNHLSNHSKSKLPSLHQLEFNKNHHRNSKSLYNLVLKNLHLWLLLILQYLKISIMPQILNFKSLLLEPHPSNPIRLRRNPCSNKIQWRDCKAKRCLQAPSVNRNKSHRRRNLKQILQTIKTVLLKLSTRLLKEWSHQESF
jgi:hypothetical protein